MSLKISDEEYRDLKVKMALLARDVDSLRATEKNLKVGLANFYRKIGKWAKEALVSQDPALIQITLQTISDTLETSAKELDPQ